MTRVEIPLVARVDDPRRAVLRDDTFQGRAGWKAIVAAPGDGTAVRSTAPSGDPTNRLRSYPEGSLSTPLDQRRATFAVRPGGGTLEAPESSGAGTTTTSRESDGLTGVFSDAASGRGSASAAAPRRFWVGRASRTLARARKGDGGRVPDRHARHGAARVRARRHGHDHPHDRGLRARARDAAAVAVHPARGPVPVADPGFGTAGGRGRDRCVEEPDAVGASPVTTTTRTTITTATVTTTITATTITITRPTR